MKIELDFKKLVEDIVKHEVKKHTAEEIKVILKQRLTKKEYKLIFDLFEGKTEAETQEKLALDEKRFNDLYKNAKKKISENF